MDRKQAYIDSTGVTVETASFKDELHAMLHVEPRGEGFEGQLRRIQAAEARLLETAGMPALRTVFRRYFLSDIANQAPLLPAAATCAVSAVQQPPLDGSKLAVWLYMRSGHEVEMREGTAIVRADGCEHYWSSGMVATQGDSAEQTASLLCGYEAWLARHGMTMERNCLRTWFCVRDVDTQYHGMVQARKDFFLKHGMTPQTHYIASTGIGGQPHEPRATVCLNAYAAKAADGSAPPHRHLSAPAWLNATSDYGVTFERATALLLPDRRHIFVSGTASIDHRGDVLFPGDVGRQTLRMLENVEALLAQAQATLADVAQAIVYLRDMADRDTVAGLLARRLPRTPLVLTLAPVCRPAWLVEMECIAIA